MINQFWTESNTVLYVQKIPIFEHEFKSLSPWPDLYCYIENTDNKYTFGMYTYITFLLFLYGHWYNSYKLLNRYKFIIILRG